MALYYLDIETDSKDPRQGSIRTIQTRDLDRPGQPLIILHADDFGGEKGLLQSFLRETKYISNKWLMTPCGYNLSFENEWFAHKALHYALVPWGWNPLRLMGKPQLDLRHFAVLCRGGVFDGTKLSDFSAKVLDGKDAARMARDRHSLEKYVAEEADAFCDLYWELVKHCGPLMEQTIRPELTRLQHQRERQREVDEQEAATIR